MIVRTIEILLEYICMIFCLHKISKRKVKLNSLMVILGAFELIFMQLIASGIIDQYFKILIHILMIVYTKKKLTKTWGDAIRVYGLVLIILMVLQILCFCFLRIFSKEIISNKYRGVFVNVLIYMVICMWRQKYTKQVIEAIINFKNVVVICIFIILLLKIINICFHNNYVDVKVALQFGIESVGLCIASLLWFNAENDKKHKMRELQMYELYNQAFEEAIVTIRIRQHEFENHINAIKCMRYTISDQEQLTLAQEQYCDKILQENDINKLLKIQMSPILIGFLYSKIVKAKEKDILVKYSIGCAEVKEYLAEYELVELIGILFDNAVEALLMNQENKVIIVNILENVDILYIEIANSSRIYHNTEIEKFCNYGFSTKGEKRGVGLSRVKEILKKNNAELMVKNLVYEKRNYLSFSTKIKKR